MFESQTNTRDSTTTSSRTLENPSGLEVGDLMILSISSGQAGGVSNTVSSVSPSGWTSIFNSDSDGNNPPKSSYLGWKVATQTDINEGEVSVTFNGASTYVYALSRISGFDEYKHSTRLRDSNNSTSRYISMPNDLKAGDLLLLHIGGGTFGNGASTPSGFTQVFNQNGSGSAPKSNLLAWKKADTSDESSVNLEITSDSTTLVCHLTRIAPEPNDVEEYNYEIGDVSFLRGKVLDAGVCSISLSTASFSVFKGFFKDFLSNSFSLVISPVSFIYKGWLNQKKEEADSWDNQEKI